MTRVQGSQGNCTRPGRPADAAENEGDQPGTGFEAVVPNPKLKLMDQVREVLRLRHYSIRTERSYCDWIRRYIKFHQMQSRADLDPAESQIELFLSDLGTSSCPRRSTSQLRDRLSLSRQWRSRLRHGLREHSRRRRQHGSERHEVGVDALQHCPRLEFNQALVPFYKLAADHGLAARRRQELILAE
jgi:hypothetical protein